MAAVEILETCLAIPPFAKNAKGWVTRQQPTHQALGAKPYLGMDEEAAANITPQELFQDDYQI